MEFLRDWIELLPDTTQLNIIKQSQQWAKLPAAIAVLVYVIIYVPETKDVPLEGIEHDLEAGVPSRLLSKRWSIRLD